MTANPINDKKDSLETTLSSIRIKELIADAEPDNPLPDAGDEGDVLTVVAGEWASAAPPSGTLPTQTGQSGKFLTTDGTDASWLSIVEAAQDAVGAMVDSTLVYTDGTPLLSRAALTGDVTASAGSNATAIANNAVTTAKIANANVTEAKLLIADNTTGNVSTSAHGFAPKAPNDATKYLDGTGAYSVPASSGGAGSGLLSGTVSKNSTTFSDASASGHSLSFDTGANERWSFVIHAEIGGATGGFKWQFTLPGGAGTLGTASAWYGITNMGSGVSMATGGSAAAVPNPSLMTIHGEVFTENAGTVMLQFAQNSASGSSFISAGATLLALRET